MTADDAGELIARCIVIWPNHPISPKGMDALIDIWVTTLGDLPLPAVQAAVMWWIAEGSGWFPNPSQLRDLAEHLLPGGIVRHDSYAFQVGLDRAVKQALEAGTALDMGALAQLEAPGRDDVIEMTPTSLNRESSLLRRSN